MRNNSISNIIQTASFRSQQDVRLSDKHLHSELVAWLENKVEPVWLKKREREK